MFIVAVLTASVGSAVFPGCRFCVEQLPTDRVTAIVTARIERKDLSIGTS